MKKILFILALASVAFGQYITAAQISGLPTGTYTPPSGTGWVYILNGVQGTTATTPTAAQVGADAAGLAVACTTGLGTKLINDTATLGTRLKNDTAGMKNDTVGMGTALAGKSATSHTHTTLDTVNIRAGKVLKLDSLKIVTGLRVTNTEQCGKLIVGTGTLALDSIEIKDGTTDTLIIGAFGKKWKFLPIANQ